MDILLKCARDFEFIKVSNNLCSTLVFHCVPGAGKSTFIRHLLNLDSRFVGITFGEPDNPNLSGRFIRSASDYVHSAGNLVLVDEYTEGDELPFPIIAFFGDPYQTAHSKRVKAATHIKRSTLRFGSETCSKLAKWGWDVSSSKVDKCSIENIFTAEPEGTVIAFEGEVFKLLESHNCPYSKICEIRGKTFDIVTLVVTGDPIKLSERHLLYQGLTRHQNKLLILCPNASYSPT
ncbi:MAG: triple gene block protein 1 [Beijing sediment betaflexivirus]|nr:MAG: triple gene block protein 1 [Beijing sediment betaflexivirus]